jgi:hypothetical protein
MPLIHTVAASLSGLGVGLGRAVAAGFTPQTTPSSGRPPAGEACRSPFRGPGTLIQICALCWSELRSIPEYGPEYIPDTDEFEKFSAVFSVS